MANTYDIFLSYASVDNTALTEPYADQTRWIAGFKVALQQAVDLQLGRTGDARWFFDAQSLRAGDDFGEEITRALNNTRLFVALISPGYFHQDSWCKREREHFLKLLGPDPTSARRVYAVVLDEPMRGEWRKQGLAEALDFAFYEKDIATDRSMRLGADGRISPKFMERVSALAADIAARLRELRAVRPAAVSRRHGSIVLAAVPGEIEDRRTELADFLAGKGWQVVPERNVCDAEIEKCGAATKTACQDAVAFIQLLSRFPWRPDELDRVQFQAALDSGMASFLKADDSKKKFFRYRSDDFDVAALTSNFEHKKWLQDHDVAARSMPSMKEELARWLDNFLAKTTQREHQEKVGTNWSAITMSVSSRERTSLGRKLSDRLRQESISTYLPMQEIPDLGPCFDKEHGFLAVFGDEIYTQRLEQVLKSWRELWMDHGIRQNYWPPTAVFLSDPPPDYKAEAINISLPDMEIISSDDEDSLKGFVAAVQSYSRNRRNSLGKLAEK